MSSEQERFHGSQDGADGSSVSLHRNTDKPSGSLSNAVTKSFAAIGLALLLGNTAVDIERFLSKFDSKGQAFQAATDSFREVASKSSQYIVGPMDEAKRTQMIEDTITINCHVKEEQDPHGWKKEIVQRLTMIGHLLNGEAPDVEMTKQVIRQMVSEYGDAQGLEMEFD